MVESLQNGVTRLHGSRRTSPADTHQEGAALQANHDVGELWDRGGTEAHVRHVLLHLEKHTDTDFICTYVHYTCIMTVPCGHNGTTMELAYY